MFGVVQRYLRGTAQTSERTKKSLQKLPPEIWWIILEMVLYSCLLVMEDFDPSEIYAAYNYSLVPYPYCSMEKAAQRQVHNRKGKLRQVCKWWKAILDDIRIDYQSIVECKYTDSVGRYGQKSWTHERNLESATIDTYRGTRLVVEAYLMHGQGSRIGIRYTYPVSSLTVRALSRDQTYNLESILDVVAFPDQLRVLDLYLESCKAPMELLQGIESKSIPLTTLSLYLKAPGSLQISLRIATLASLFLSIPAYNSQDWLWGDPSNFRWTLPALVNLAIIERHERRHGPPSTVLPSTHSFFLNLLGSHFSSIRSLLMHPMTAQVSSQKSPLCWAKMPNLQALATNFSDMDVSIHTKNLFGKEVQTLKSESVRHLIQFHLWVAGSNSMASELQRYIRACTNLESVTMVNAPGFDTREWATMRPEKEIIKLLKLCDTRAIDLWAQDVHCTWRKIVSQKMIGKRR